MNDNILYVEAIILSSYQLKAPDILFGNNPTQLGTIVVVWGMLMYVVRQQEI